MHADPGGSVGDVVRSPGSWIMEPKLDGWRLLTHVTEDGVRMFTRRGAEKTGYVPHIAADLEWLHPGTVLDGEIVALGTPESEYSGGVRSVGSIMGLGSADRAARASGELSYLVFDLLCHGGLDARPLPLSARRQLLESVFVGDACEATSLVPQYEATQANHDVMLDLGFEGSVLKRTGSPYNPRRSSWHKIKSTTEIDAVVLGTTDGEGDFEGLVGALIFGQFKDGQLARRGTCSGMTIPTRLAISADRDDYVGRVIEVRHNGIWPESGDLRSPRFIRFRDDKAAEECTWTLGPEVRA